MRENTYGTREISSTDVIDQGNRLATRFLLVREAAAIMRMDESTLYRHLRAGRFPAVKVGGRYLVPAAAVAQMADEAVASG